MKKILVVVPFNDREKKMLEEHADGRAQLVYKKESEITAADLNDVQGVIGIVPPELLSGTGIQWVQLSSAGQDPYVKPGVLPEGCMLYNAVGAYGRTVSEHALALTFSLIRKLDLYRDSQRQHLWKEMGPVTSIEGSTVLVLGLGDIGGSTARKMKALGAYVIGVRASAKKKPDYVDEQVTMEHLAEVIGRADIIVSTLPSTPETRGLFDEKMLAECRTGAYLVNCGRGDLIDLSALMTAVESGRLAGAALDVTDPEPLPEDHPLWECSRIILTPHVAGGFNLQQTLDRIAELACVHMDEWL